MISRRKFVKKSLQAAAASPLLLSSLTGCQKNTHAITGSIVGQNAALGHKLRRTNFGEVAETIHQDIVIVGGGVSGLSAARYLKKFTNNFTLLELNDETGGNAMGGVNSVSSYPWGAHYLPLPGDNDAELLSFLEASKVITGYTNSLPVYNEYYLCFDPKERLYINNYWQEGLLPREGIPKKDHDEIQRFTELMDTYKHMTGSDGRPAFTIPLDFSSTDTNILALDEISMDRFLKDHEFHSPFLTWYVNYCCADDYGSSIADTSAWAGIHYFASRTGKSANATSDTVLTWPEGNYWLIKELRKNLESHIRTQSLAFKVDITGKDPSVVFYDAVTDTTKQITARAVILATPQFINQRLLGTIERTIDYAAFQYAPWMVSNVTVDAMLNEKHGEGLCWDNVIYGSESLGYVSATHQSVGHTDTKKVLTYYKPLLGSDVNALRKKAHDTSYEAWKNMTIQDLSIPHPKLKEHILSVDVWIWGHAMVRPGPGFIWSANREHSTHPINDTIFFAHSDTSGLSIFEEAFYRGHTAAKQALTRI